MGRRASYYDEFMPRLTSHASCRMGSRRISPSEVAAVMTYGRDYHVRGAVIYAMSNQEIACCCHEGMAAERMKGLQVVCAPDTGVVITVYRNRDLSHLRRRSPRRGHSW
jgi:hypothetical protein